MCSISTRLKSVELAQLGPSFSETLGFHLCTGLCHRLARSQAPDVTPWRRSHQAYRLASQSGEIWLVFRPDGGGAAAVRRHNSGNGCLAFLRRSFDKTCIRRNKFVLRSCPHSSLYCSIHNPDAIQACTSPQKSPADHLIVDSHDIATPSN